MFVWSWEVSEIATGGAKELMDELRLSRETLSRNLASRPGAFCMDSDEDSMRQNSPKGTGSHGKLLELASSRSSSLARRLFAQYPRTRTDKRRSAPTLLALCR